MGVQLFLVRFPGGLDLGVRLVHFNVFTAFVMISHHYQYIMCRFVHVWNKLLVHNTLNNFFKIISLPSEGIFHAATYKETRIVVTPAQEGTVFKLVIY